MNMDNILSAATAIGMAAGGFASGRWTGRNSSSSVAADTVAMLQAQVDVLERDKERREVELADLRNRVAVLEGLVTQRAEVEELSNRVSLVKGVVDRIAVKVAA